jgi:hypothetical protein
VIIGAKNGSAVDVSILRRSGAANLVFGHEDNWNLDLYGSATDVYGKTSLTLHAGSGFTMVASSDGTAFNTALPLAGRSSSSQPMRLKQAAITQASTADTTLTSAQYE